VSGCHTTATAVALLCSVTTKVSAAVQSMGQSQRSNQWWSCQTSIQRERLLITGVPPRYWPRSYNSQGPTQLPVDLRGHLTSGVGPTPYCRRCPARGPNIARGCNHIVLAAYLFVLLCHTDIVTHMRHVPHMRHVLRPMQAWMRTLTARAGGACRGTKHSKGL
jgi:hypothetical protein